EVQLYGIAVLILMRKLRDLCTDLGVYSELFFQLAVQRRGGLLAGFDLAAGKFPLEREGLIFDPLAAEHLASAQDHRCHDLLGHTITGACAPEPALSLPKGSPVVWVNLGDHYIVFSRHCPTSRAQCSTSCRSSGVNAAGVWLSMSSS